MKLHNLRQTCEFTDESYVNLLIADLHKVTHAQYCAVNVDDCDSTDNECAVQALYLVHRLQASVICAVRLNSDEVCCDS